MSSIKRRDDGKWRARYRDAGGKEHAGHFATKAKAQAWLDRETASLVRGDWTDPKAGKVTFGDYANDWFSHQRVRGSTRDQYDSKLRTHLLPVFGDRQLASIRPSELRSWRSGLSVAPSTAVGVERLLRSILQAAVDDRVIAQNPAVQKREKQHDGRAPLVPLSIGQVHAIADAIRPDVRAMVLVAAGTGLRQGELLGLDPDRIRWLRREIVVDRQLATPNRGEPHFAPPKTPRSNRIVPVAPAVLDVLAQHLENYAPNRDGLIFHNRGTRWRRDRFGQIWRPARVTAGVDANFHDLRHHFASLLIAASCSVRAVCDVLGHSSAVETLNTYSHLWPTDHDRVRDAVQRELADFSRTGEASVVSE